jgi:hypothetical protein
MRNDFFGPTCTICESMLVSTDTADVCDECARVEAKDDRKDAEYRDSIEGEYSDAFKQANGFRPRGDYSWRGWSDARLEAATSAYYAQAVEADRIPASGIGWAYDGRELN